jgi:hypothetical protein
MEHTLKQSEEQLVTSEATPEQKEEKLLTELSDSTNNPTQSEPSNPFTDPCFVDDTEEFLGKGIGIVGAPPPQKRS